MSTQLAMSDEEVFLLSYCDETWHEDARHSTRSLAEDEMRCQRDMRVRGRRLWRYHLTIGDLWEIMGIAPTVALQ